MTDSDQTILRAKVVLPMNAPPIDDGAVLVTGHTIRAVGSWSEIQATASAATVRDLGEQVLLPGLINAHCHLDYSCLKGQVHYAHSFIEWILSLVQLRDTKSEQEYRDGFRQGADELIRSGTTTAVNITTFPGLVDAAGDCPLRLIWCFELLDFGQDRPADELFAELENFIDSHPQLPGNYGLAPHAPYTTSEGLYVLAARAAEARGCLLTTHLAESVEEDDMFRRGQGHMFDYFRRQGRDMSDCKHQGVFQLFTDLGVLGPHCLLAHVNHPTRRDLELLRESGAHVVHCPKTHRFFHRDTAPIKLLTAAGINVCLGTDSLASNDSLDLIKEMHTFALDFTDLPAEQIVRMATTAPARALGHAKTLGVLTPRADLIALLLQSDSPDPYESVVYADRPPSHVMVGGKFVIG